MSTVINHPGVGEFVAEHAKALFTPGHDVTFGTLRDGRIIGGVIYTNFTGATCQGHIAGTEPGWITPDLLWVSFNYPFVQLGYRKIYACVDSANDVARRINQKMGYQIEAALKDVFPASDMLVMSLRREDCRYLNIQPRAIRAGGDHGR